MRPMPIIVTAHHAEDLKSLEIEWRDLEMRADASFFQSWLWIGCWLEQTGLRPLVLKASVGSQIVGLGLLHSARCWRHGWLPVNSLLLHESGDPVIDGIFIENNGFLVDRRWERAITEQFLKFLIAQSNEIGILHEWDELRFGGVPASYSDIARATGLAVRIVDQQPSSAINLQKVCDSGQDYLSFLSANTRQQIRRSMRLYSERGELVVEAARDVPEALGFLENLKSLHQVTWERRGKAGAFSNPFFELFHHELIRQCLPLGNVEVLRVRAGASNIGYLYNFIHRGWVGNYASGFSYEEDRKMKPGLVCLLSAVGRYSAQGASIFDLMAGKSRYKTSLSTSETTLYWIALQRPRFKFALENLLRLCRNAVTGRG